MSETHLTVGDRIRTLRRLRRASQIELAKAIGVYQSTLSRIESGQFPLSPERKADIEKYLGVSLDDPRIEGAITALAAPAKKNPNTTLALAA